MKKNATQNDPMNKISIEGPKEEENFYLKQRSMIHDNKIVELSEATSSILTESISLQIKSSSR